ncbi:hypothetical protein ABMA28_011352 [Loxostege sticticalis]|uniref:C2H2-type domain-containing protein n=1 Tax=Loxostege sticticalis TaxID=481309 RepID=A0ABD0SAX5_LOXSC
MVEPAKPFACTMPDCGMTFTNEDHLHVHTKKHDMILQFGLEQKAAFVADQTPTPTRFIRNCEEVGLFQDLTVNPFEEGFKRAMEYKHGNLLETAPTSTSDDLHTPQMVFPIDPGDSTLYTSNNQRNITISRSSSDESGTIKEYETTTISKLTNEVTTISRVVNKHDILDKIHPTEDIINKTDDIRQKDVHNETSVSFTNNVIKIHNNIEIRKDNLVNIETAKTVPNLITYTDSVIKDTNSITAKDVLLADGSKNQMQKVPPMMSQKSLDFVVDCLTSDLCRDEIKKPAPKPKTRKVTKPKSPVAVEPKNVTKEDDYEVIIKLPNGKQVRMKAVEDLPSPDKGKNIDNNTKEKLKLAINNKVSQKQTVIHRIPSINAPMQTILPISTGTLIPVTIIPSNNTQIVQKVPIAPFNHLLKPNQEFKKTVKRKNDKIPSVGRKVVNNNSVVDDDVIVIDEDDAQPTKRSREDLNSRVAASRRYRVRLRETMRRQVAEIKQLKETNQRLTEEKAVLQVLITEHMKECPNAEHLRATQEKLMPPRS